MTRRRPTLPAPAGLSLAAALFLASAPLRAQAPADTFKNLQVLPKDISRDSLFTVMRGFADGLGVRCDFCHVAPEGTPFPKWPFQKDDKATKRKARFMLRMVEYLNGERLPELPEAAKAEREDPPVQVTCRTCHRGVPVPRPLDEVLALTAGSAGTDSAVAEYGDLRKAFYGRGAYDFGEETLIAAARRRMARQDTAGARRFLALNLESFPESVRTYVALAQVAEARSDTAAALDALHRAADLHPEGRTMEHIQKEIERLSPPGTSGTSGP